MNSLSTASGDTSEIFFKLLITHFTYENYKHSSSRVYHRKLVRYNRHNREKKTHAIQGYTIKFVNAFTFRITQRYSADLHIIEHNEKHCRSFSNTDRMVLKKLFQSCNKFMTIKRTLIFGTFLGNLRSRIIAHSGKSL